MFHVDRLPIACASFNADVNLTSLLYLIGCQAHPSIAVKRSNGSGSILEENRGAIKTSNFWRKLFLLIKLAKKYNNVM